MKKIFILSAFLFAGLIAYSQSTISGTLIDEITEEPLIGATVVIVGTSVGVSSDLDGKFTLTNVPNGVQQIRVSYLGYEDMLQEVTVNGDVNLETLRIKSSEVGLSEVEILGSIGKDRRTPVAFTDISGDEVALKVGNQEYVEILRKTPSVYVTKQGGGFGDSRINVRGFDQRNTAVMINGIPVNDMENGWVYWSNWAGLSDVTSKIQIQRGLGATKLAAPTVGGSINIITNAAEIKRKGTYSVGIGNDGYFKTGLSYSTGLLSNGLAASFQVTRRQGNGYVDGTQFSAWSYFLALSKVFSREHTISFSAVGAPQWHHQRNRPSQFDNLSLQTFVDKGYKYNNASGTLNGEEFTWRRNFYHKPKVFLNHYWNINNRTDIKTSAYASFGRGGGTGPRGRLRTPSAIFDSYTNDNTGLYNGQGQVRFDDIVAYNQGNNVNNDTTLQNWGVKDTLDGQYIVTNNGGDGGSGFVRRSSMNYHNWFGLLSTLTQKLGDDLTLTTGIDGRYYKGEHFRILENLMGADGYLSRSDINNPNNFITEPVSAKFGNIFNNSYKNGNVINYHNDGIVGWAGAFTQLEYVNNNITAFASLSGSNQSFRRIDYFNYYNDENRDSISAVVLAAEGQEAKEEWLVNNPSQKSDWANILGGTVKAGVNYNFGNSNAFVNGGYLSRQPIFDNVFLNFSNDIDKEIENQTVAAFEAGYGFKSDFVDLKLNLYTTQWLNQTFSRGEDYALIAENDTTFTDYGADGGLVELSFAAGDTLVNGIGSIFFENGTAIFRNVDQRHNGLEIETQLRPNKFLDIDFNVSIGNWIYTDDFDGEIFDDAQESIGPTTLYVKDQPIGDAAQTTFSIGASLKPIKGLRIYADWFYADRLYAQFRVTEAKFAKPGGNIVQLPSYSLLDGGISYGFKLPNNMRISAYVNVNNVLDDIYLSEMFTNEVDNPNTENVNEFYTSNQGFFGFGRTWNTGLRFKF